MHRLLATLLLSYVAFAGTANITVAPSATFQTWRYNMMQLQPTPAGIGTAEPDVNADWNSSLKSALLGQLVNQLGINTVQLTVSSGDIENNAVINGQDAWTYYNLSAPNYSGWGATRYAPANDDSNPNHFNCPDATLVNCVGSFPLGGMDYAYDNYLTGPGGMQALVQANGEKLHIDFQWIHWPSSATYLDTDPAEEGEHIVAAFTHIRNKYGSAFVPDIFDVMVEPDLHCDSIAADCGNGGVWDETKLGNALAAIKSRLNAAGFNPQIWCCSVTSSAHALAWYTNVKAQAGFTPDALTTHWYDAPGASYFPALISQAAADSIPLVMTELDDLGVDNIYTLMTTGNVSGVEKYDAAHVATTDAASTLLTITSTSPYASRYVGSASGPSYTWFFPELWKYIRDGDVREQAVSDNGNFLPLAFRSRAGLDKIPVLIHASGSQTVNVTGAAAGTYGCTYTYSNSVLLQPCGANQTIAAGGTLTATLTNIPPNSPGSPTAAVVTFYGIPAALPPIAPAISSLTPLSATAGAAPFTLTVNGTGFVSGDTIAWSTTNQTSIVTTYVNATTLTAQVPASLLATAGTAQITVGSPAGVPSNASTFTITPAAGPAIASISPPSVKAGSPSVTVTITGASFAGSSAAKWNGLLLVTNYVSSTTLTAQIPAGDLVSQGTGQITVVNPTGAASNSFPFIVSSDSPLQFLTVAPCRIMDTRNPDGPFGGPFIAAGTSRTITIPSSACGIPANALAYSLNFTVVPGAGALAYLSVWPTGQPQPLVSTLNSLDGSTIANAAIVPAGTAGAIDAYATDDTELIVDINGYFVPPAADTLQFYPLTPCRVLDTRNPTGTFGGPSIAGGSSRSFPIPSSSCGVPANATAYAFNVTVVPQGALSYLTAWPTEQAQPFVSTLNSLDGTILANAAIVPAGTGGAASFYATNTTDLVVDINGYFAPPGSGGLNFYTATPCRLVDTRNPNGPFGGPTMGADTTRVFPLSQDSCGLPGSPGGRAYSLNITVVPQGALDYLSIWATGEAQPFVSTLNAFEGQTVANAAIVPAGGASSITVYVTNTTDVVIDTNGYFGP